MKRALALTLLALPLFAQIPYTEKPTYARSHDFDLQHVNHREAHLRTQPRFCPPARQPPRSPLTHAATILTSSTSSWNFLSISRRTSFLAPRPCVLLRWRETCANWRSTASISILKPLP